MRQLRIANGEKRRQFLTNALDKLRQDEARIMLDMEGMDDVEMPALEANAAPAPGDMSYPSDGRYSSGSQVAGHVPPGTHPAPPASTVEGSGAGARSNLPARGVAPGQHDRGGHLSGVGAAVPSGALPASMQSATATFRPSDQATGTAAAPEAMDIESGERNPAAVAHSRQGEDGESGSRLPGSLPHPVESRVDQYNRPGGDHSSTSAEESMDIDAPNDQVATRTAAGRLAESGGGGELGTAEAGRAQSPGHGADMVDSHRVMLESQEHGEESSGVKLLPDSADAPHLAARAEQGAAAMEGIQPDQGNVSSSQQPVPETGASTAEVQQHQQQSSDATNTGTQDGPPSAAANVAHASAQNAQQQQRGAASSAADVLSTGDQEPGDIQRHKPGPNASGSPMEKEQASEKEEEEE
eukprot:scpid15729/ scgid34042/ 